jgi:hypothetical protein
MRISPIRAEVIIFSIIILLIPIQDIALLKIIDPRLKSRKEAPSGPG